MKKLIIAITLFILARPGVILAMQQTPTITISPAFKELVLSKNQPEHGYDLEISNGFDVDLAFTIKAIDYKGLDEGGGLALVGQSKGGLDEKYNLAKWVNIENPQQIVAKKSKKVVKIVVKNLDSLTPGAHYGSILIETNRVGDTHDVAKVSFNQNINTQLFVKKLGGEHYDMSLKQINVFKSLFKLPNKISLDFVNKGNVHVVPRGEILINNPRNHTVAKGLINKESSYILPEKNKVLDIEIKNLQRIWMPGKYNVTTYYSYEGLNKYATKVVEFWYFPPYLILVSIVIILLIVFFKKWKKYISQVVKTLISRLKKFTRLQNRAENIDLPVADALSKTATKNSDNVHNHPSSTMIDLPKNDLGQVRPINDVVKLKLDSPKAPPSPGQLISADNGLPFLDDSKATSSVRPLRARADLPWERATLRKSSKAENKNQKTNNANNSSRNAPVTELTSKPYKLINPDVKRLPKSDKTLAQEAKTLVKVPEITWEQALLSKKAKDYKKLAKRTKNKSNKKNKKPNKKTKKNKK